MWQYQYPDELYHWKYIKKKKVNGKWRYYYDVKDALGYDERKEAAQAVYDYERAKTNYKGYSSIKNDPTREKWHTNEEEKAYETIADINGKRAGRALDKYYKTPLGKIDSLGSKINDGRRVVADLLDAVSKKIRPEKWNVAQFTKYR